MNKTSNATSIVNAQPGTPVSCNKKIKKHSLKPQIFLQLELSSPRSCGKTVDPSAVSVLKKNWAKEENDFVTHVRLEHCNGLQEETVIRCENSDEENPAGLPKIPSITSSVHSRKERFQRLAEAAATPPANDGCNDVPKITQESPTSVMSLKQVVPYPENGRHDQHLQEDVPLPALAPSAAVAAASTITKDEPGELSSTSPKSTSNDASVFDASDSNLANVFALVDEDEIAPQQHRRSSRRLLLLGCESDDEAETRLEPEPASPVSLGSIRKAYRSRRRSGMRRSQSCSVLDTTEDAKKDERRSRNQHTSSGETKNTEEDEAQTSKMTSKVDKSHQRVRSTRSRQSVQELLEGDERNRPTRSTRRSSQSVMELPREKSRTTRSSQSVEELLEGLERSRPTRSFQSVVELPVNQEMTPRRRSSRSSQSVVELPRVHERTHQRRSSRSEQERRGGQGAKKEDVSTGKDAVLIKKPSSSSRRRHKSDEGSLLKKDDCESDDKRQTRSEEFVVPRGASTSGEQRSRRRSSAKDDYQSDDKRQTRSEEFVVPRGASASAAEERSRRRSSSTRTSGSISTNSSRRGSSSSSSSGSSSGPKRSGTDEARNMKKDLVPVTEEHQHAKSSSKKPKMRRRSTSTTTRAETKKPNQAQQ